MERLPKKGRPFGASWLALTVGLGLALSACATPAEKARYKYDVAAARQSQIEGVGLHLGEFRLDGSDSVLDGDTIRINGLKSSMRLIALDTEETFKHAADRKAFDAGWEQYKKSMRADSSRPVKMATPMGEEAKRFAQKFFEGVHRVKLERDHPAEIRDYYGRYLVYVFAEKDGRWVNFNVEAVRAGMSPYFTKYGRSRRFHREFLDAQLEARSAKVGIWDPTKQHYDDYEERLKWWNERGDKVARFEKEMEESEDHFVLTRWDSVLKLEQHVGQKVTVFGAVSEIRLGDEGPSLVKLSMRKSHDFDVVFFDKDVFYSSGIVNAKGEYVQIRGVVTKYFDKRKGLERLQIVVSLPGQVLAPSKQLDQLLAEDHPKQGPSPADYNAD